MTDEGIWLLLFGGEWVSLEVIADEYDDVFTRLAKANRLEVNKNCVRLKPKEENEFIRV